MVYCATVSKSAFFNGAATRSNTLAKMQWRMVIACLLFSMRLRSSARSLATCSGEGVSG